MNIIEELKNGKIIYGRHFLDDGSYDLKNKKDDFKLLSYVDDPSYGETLKYKNMFYYDYNYDENFQGYPPFFMEDNEDEIYGTKIYYGRTDDGYNWQIVIDDNITDEFRYKYSLEKED